nr:hypothetical protein CFP56_36812 [Quercus suber]
MEDYKATAETVVCKTTVADGQRSWALPPENVFKINIDGAVFASQNIRDEKGRLEAAMSKKIPVPLFAVKVEAMTYE